MALLTQAQLQAYEQDGILFPIPALTSDETSRFVDELAKIEARMGGKPSTEELHQLFHHFAWAYDLATHPKILDAVESILGPNILVWATSVFSKHPRDPGFISWHQDGTYWGLSSDQVTTAWIALTDSFVENGCMRVVRQSHSLPIQPHIDTYAADNQLSRGQEIAVDVNEEDATDVVLQRGEFSLHHVNIIHGSRANPSDKKRIGFVARYITPAVQQSGHPQSVILARGEDRYHHFDHVERPADSQDIDRALESHLRAAREHISDLRKTKGAYETKE